MSDGAPRLKRQDNRHETRAPSSDRGPEKFGRYVNRLTASGSVGSYDLIDLKQVVHGSNAVLVW